MPAAARRSPVVETQGAQPLLLHGLCLCLLLGRLAHAFGVSQTAENLSFRVTGMALTFTTIFFSSAWLLLAAVRQDLAWDQVAPAIDVRSMP